MFRKGLVTSFVLNVPRQYSPDRFRIGGPRPLPPSPYEFPIAATEPICAIWPTLRPIIISHLSEQGVSRYDLRVVHRRATKEPNPRIDDTTVLIVTPTRSDSAWLILQHKILQTFQTLSLPNLNVEICDPRALRGKFTWPILANESVCELWPKIHGQVLEALEGLDWQTLVLVHRGYDQSLSKRTILVTERQGSLLNWNPAPLNQICAHHRLDYEVNEDNTFGLTNGWANQYSMEEFTESDGLLPIKMGASCSARGLTASGTLGGFVNLERNGITMKYGVTCYHVFTNAIDDEKFNSKGIRPNEATPLRVLVDSPSAVDRNASRQYWGREVARTAESIQRVENEIQDVYGGHATRQNASRLAALSEEIEQYKANEEEVAQCNLLAGTLFAGSGLLRYGGQERFSLDWALISLDPRRDGRNKLPTKDEPQVKDTDYRPDSPFLQTISEEHLQAHFDNKVFKRGRSTGLTWGTVNAIKVDIKLGDSVPHTAWYIVGSLTASAFAEPGDSGAFVLDRYGAWCGIVFGGSDDGNGYVTPVNRVVADIEALTGGHVSLP